MDSALNNLVFRDTPFAELMQKRIYNVLLIATKYDAFMLEDDGRVDEQIFNEYTALNLRYPPRFTRVSDEEEALQALADRNFELVVVMPNMAGKDIFSAANSIKSQYPQIPIVVLTPFSKEVTRRMAGTDLSNIDYMFSWLGNSDLLLAIIKIIEDKLNAPDDMQSVGVQAILLVEDSVRFYSSALPCLYKIVLEQSRKFSTEALNDHLKMLRMRGRPKVLLARSYEEAMEILQAYPNNILGVVSDMDYSYQGSKHPQAGLILAQEILKDHPYLPFILESSDFENKQYADELGLPFIAKQSKTYPQDLRSQIMKHFGFGDFVIINPQTNEELLRISNLKELQNKIFDIPDSSLYYHLKNHHFSRFLYSHAIFPPAEVLSEHDVTQYANMDEARKYIFDLIVGYRRMKNAGVVAIYQKDRFDEYSNFARIGNGSLGGKGRGLAFMGSLINSYPQLSTPDFQVNIPKTVVICTDIFDEFMERNKLYDIALSDATDEEILNAFEKATLRSDLLEDLLSLFKVGHSPIAIRSSSVLEDSHYQPFAGIYATYMIPRSPDNQVTLQLVRSAIKAVYASVFYRDSKAYLTATQNLIDQEKMAVVLQEVVGEVHGQLYYPTLSGVARSLNFYPIGNERADEGIVSMAVGLGKHIVDGGVSLRFSPAHPSHLLQLSSPEYALRETQRDFLGLDLTHFANDFTTDDAFNLCKLSLNDFPANCKAARFVFSTYDLQNQRLCPGIADVVGRRIVSFNGLLQSDTYPLSSTIAKLLQIGEKEMGRPVEVEFVMQINDDKAYFYLLQIRPIVDRSEDISDNVMERATGEMLLQSNHVLGNGHITDVSHILYVRTQHFNPANNRQLAAEIAQINDQMICEETGYVLVGPGRWGSSDPWLGIPVKWPQISQSRVIVECGLSAYRVDPSQGSHFFQNLTSLGVGYFTISPYLKDGIFNEDWLDKQPAVYESENLRLVKFTKPLCILMNGRSQQGKVLFNDAQ